MKDKFTTCKRCGSKMCYESNMKRLTSFTCLTCGFTSRTTWLETNKSLNEELSILPQLYQDLKFTDVDGYIWIPTTINFPQKGMVFANGKSTDSWFWTAILSTKVEEDEKEKFKKPGMENEYFTHKMDNKTIKNFSKDEFLQAINYIGAFQDEQ